MEALSHLIEQVAVYFASPLWGATRGAYILSLTIFLLFFILRGLLADLILRVFNSFMKKMNLTWDQTYSDPMRIPLKGLFLLIGFTVATQIIPGAVTHSPTLITSLRIGIILLVAYTLMLLDGLFTFMFKGLENRMNVSRSKLLQQFSVRIYRFVLIVMTIAIVLSQVGIDVGAMLAGLGLAGLAFALAAQDTLSNVFAGVTMIVDKPFDVGDRILSQGIDGVVEDINFRSTRIRTLEQEFVTLPNAKVAGGAIVNYTRRDMRKRSMVLSFVYGTPVEQLKGFIAALEKELMTDVQIAGDSTIVKLQGFSASGIDILVYYLTTSSDWVAYLTINERVNIKVLNIIEAMNMSLAYPSTSIYFENSLINKGEQDNDQDNRLV